MSSVVRGQGPISVRNAHWNGDIMFSKCWKSQKLCINKLKRVLPKIFFRRNNIHREIDQWNRHRFGAKWHVTVPNSITPIKPCANEYACHRGDICQMTQKLHVYLIFIRIFVKLWFREFFYQIHDEKCSFLSFSKTRVKHIIWNQNISVNVYVA